MTTPVAASVRPTALDAIPQRAVIVADVRDELRAGREPFGMIMAARRAMPEGGALCVQAIFEPVPLYAVMQRQGLLHWTEQRAPDDWLVWFYAEPVQAEAAAASVRAAAPAQSEAEAGAFVGDDGVDDNVVVLDVRGLEPPEPLLRTLAALEQMPRDATLVQVNVRVPQYLLPLLAARGYTYEIREQGGDLVRLFIRHGTV